MRKHRLRVMALVCALVMAVPAVNLTAAEVSEESTEGSTEEATEESTEGSTEESTEGSTEEATEEAAEESTEDTTEEVPEEEPAALLVNGGFEADVWGSDGGWSVTADSWAGDHSTNNHWEHFRSGSGSFTYWFAQETTLHLSQQVALEAGEYEFGGYFDGAMAVPTIEVLQEGTSLADDEVTLDGYGNWVKGTADFSLAEAATVTVQIDVEIPDGGWGYIDDMYLVEKAAEEEEEEELDRVNIQPVAGLSRDFMCAVDVSSVISLENAGVKYYNQAGEEEDIFKILHDSGVNTVRVRIWNDPHDKNGNFYGGGNNDLATAKLIAGRATAAGLKIYVDFHYSDFWATPSKQERPKAWKGLSTAGIVSRITSFTTDALQQLREVGADISIVQIGNETSGYFLGSKDWATMARYFNAGSKAVRAFDENIKVMIQFGGVGNVTRYDGYCKNLEKYKVDYDILGASWYPFYKSHGTIDNLQKNLNNVVTKYGKEVMVVENSYPTTYDDADGHSNNFSYETYGSVKKQCKWDISVQGQAQQIRDIIEVVSNLDQGKGTGYCYWEPAWISVGDTTNLTGDAWEAQYKSNKEKWNTYGCGWASKYSSNYYSVSKGAAKYHGGSSWDNMAMFDQKGRALDSLNVFKYIYDGSAETPYVTSYEEPEVVLKAGANLSEDEVWHQIWWDKVNCTYSNGESKWTNVRWIREEGKPIISAYKKKSLGTYTFYGSTSNFQGYAVTMKVIITGDDDYIKKCSLSKTRYVYNGKACKPTVKVVNKKGKTLKQGKSYTVSYEENCTDPGTYTVTVKGINNYSFEKVLSYTIAAKK